MITPRDMVGTKIIKSLQTRSDMSQHYNSFASESEKRYALAPKFKPKERLLEQAQSCKIHTNGKLEPSDSVNLVNLDQNSAPDSSKTGGEAL